MARPPCLFCRILAGEVAARFVATEERYVAFLDHRPLFPGHCLLVPREHYETLMDVTASDIGPIFEGVARLARAVEKGLGCEGIFVANNNRVSQSVPHLHVHVVPRARKDGLKGFFWPRHGYTSDDEMAEFASRIRAAF